MQKCFEELIFSYMECKKNSEYYDKISEEKIAVNVLNDLWYKICYMLKANIKDQCYQNLSQLFFNVPLGDTNNIKSQLYMLENLSQSSQSIVRNIKSFITEGYFGESDIDILNLQKTVILPVCYKTLKDCWYNQNQEYRNNNFYILKKFITEFPDTFHPSMTFWDFSSKFNNLDYHVLKNIFQDTNTKIFNHRGLCDCFNNLFKIHIGYIKIESTTTNYLSENQVKDMTKTSNKSAKFLTPEEREFHYKQKIKERNKKRQEKITQLRKIDKESDNKNKIITLLKIYNRELSDTDINLLEFHLAKLLDDFSLI